MECIDKGRLMKKANNTVGDKRHPLASSLNPLQFGRHYCPPLVSKNRSKFLFVPHTITFKKKVMHIIIKQDVPLVWPDFFGARCKTWVWVHV